MQTLILGVICVKLLKNEFLKSILQKFNKPVTILKTILKELQSRNNI